LIIVGVFLGPFFADASDCPSGWTYLAATDACYAVFQKSSNFTEAQDFCAMRGGNLASVTDDQEITLLMDMSPKSPSTASVGCAQQLLTGGIKYAGQSKFVWNDGMPWSAYSNGLWATGAPHPGSGADSAQLTLFAYGSNQRGKLSDCAGSTKFDQFACELEVVPILIDAAGSTTTAAPGTCCPTNGTWGAWAPTTTCTDPCGSFGTQTVSRNCTSNAATCPCVGATTKTAICNTQLCQYSNYAANTKYTICNTGYSPQMSGSIYICGPVPQDNYTSCTAAAFAFHQSNKCAKGWSYFNGTNSCYRVYTVKRSPILAQTACANNGANLASLTTAAEVTFVMKLTNSSMKNVHNVTIGAKNTNKKSLNTFIWTDKTKWTKFSQSLWAPKNPNNKKGQEGCTALIVNQKPYVPGKMVSASCTVATTPFICKMHVVGNVLLG